MVLFFAPQAIIPRVSCLYVLALVFPRRVLTARVAINSVGKSLDAWDFFSTLRSHQSGTIAVLTKTSKKSMEEFSTMLAPTLVEHVRFPTDITLLYEGDLEPLQDAAVILERNPLLHVKFANVTSYFLPTEAEWDQMKSPDAWTDGCSSWDQCMGYRKMCEFWSMHVYKLPELEPYRYIWRLDTDSMLTKPVLANLYDELENRGAIVGYGPVMHDYPAACQGLQEATTDFFTANPQWSPKTQSQKQYLNEYYQHSCPLYNTNFILLDLDFFRESAPYKAYVNHIHNVGGFAKHRWGDHIVLTLFLHTQEPLERLLCMRNWVPGYSHQHEGINCHDYVGARKTSSPRQHGSHLVFIVLAVMVVFGAMALFAGWVAHGLLVPVSAWFAAAVCMNIVNKLLVVNLGAPVVVLLLQLLLANFVLMVGLGRKLISEIQSKSSAALRWVFLVIPFSGMLITSIMAFKTGSVTEIVTLRSALPVVTFFAEGLFLSEDAPQATLQRLGALFVIALGSVGYVTGDHVIKVDTLVLMFLNMLFTVSHRLAERKLLVEADMHLSFVAMTWVNNMVGLLPVVALGFGTNELMLWPQLLGEHGQLWDPMTMALLVLSGLVGLGFGWSSIVVQKEITATSFFVLQAASKIIIIFTARSAFGEKMTLLSCAGCLASLGGCLWYSVAGTSDKGKK